MPISPLETAAAAAYENFFVPALFSRWAEIVADHAGIREGDQVVDVACGTGALSRAAAKRAGSNGLITGVDIDKGMLSVAAQLCPDIQWLLASADDLPFADYQFHRVVTQFGFMFFPDPQRSLQEMVRVLKPGGVLALAVWNALESCPAYALADEIYQCHLGQEAIASLREPYGFGNPATLRHVFIEAGLSAVSISTHETMARFPDVRSMVLADIDGWLPREASHYHEDVVELIVQEVGEALQNFTEADGTITFQVSAHIAKVCKPAVR